MEERFGDLSMGAAVIAWSYRCNIPVTAHENGKNLNVSITSDSTNVDEVKAKLAETKEHVLAFILHQGVAFEALEYGHNRINGLSNELLNLQGQVDELEEACELVWGATNGS